jgi:hypothetical protein
VPTNRTIPNNKPDIIIHDNENEGVSKDVAISGDRNVIRKDTEILKYNRHYKRNTVHVECKNIIPVIIRANRTNSKSFTKYVSNIERKHKIQEIQKTDTAVRTTGNMLNIQHMKYH